MAQIEVLSEQEGGAGWIFQTQVLDDAGVLRQHRVSLSWADYDLWCRGGDAPPARLAEAVLAFLLGRMDAAELRPAFDASIARRYDGDADTAIPRLV